METVSIGSGQMHQISMMPVANPLDTMQDRQKILIGGGDDMNGESTIVRRLTPL